MEIETRYCKHCKHRTFKVLKTSDQLFCGSLCEEYFNPKAAEARKKKWSAERSIQIKKIKEKQKKENARKLAESMKERDTIGSSRTSRASGKKNMLVETLTPQKIENEKGSSRGKVTNDINLKRMQPALSGEEKTKSASSEHKGNTMPETEDSSSIRSLQPVVVESPPLDLQKYSATLRQEELGSMSLIDSSAKDLHTVMRSLVKRHDDNPVRTYSYEDVQSICMLAGNIKGLMQVKVDAIKTAKEMLQTVSEIEGKE